MDSFSEQCLDMARSMLSHNLDSINPDGTITPIEGGRTIKRAPETRGLGPDMAATVALDEVEVILSGSVSLLAFSVRSFFFQGN